MHRIFLSNQSRFIVAFLLALACTVSGCVSQRDTVVLAPRSPPLLTGTEATPVKKTFNLEKTVAVNSSLNLITSVKLALDCTPQNFDDEIKILQQPLHGAVKTVTENIFPQFPQGIPQYACNAKRAPARLIIYKPEADYVGPDSVVIESIGPGADLTRSFAITVK